MGAIEDVLAANQAAATDHVGGAPATPARRLAIVTCMDARVDPAAAFGLASGDAHVIRNAGGRASDDALRSLAASWHLLDTRAVMVIHHSRCGMLTPDAEEVRRRVEASAGAELGGLDLLTFADEDGAVRDDVARIRDWPLTPADAEIRGFVYDVDTGLLREVPTEPGDRTDRTL